MAIRVSLLSLPDEVLYLIVFFWMVSGRDMTWTMKDVSYSWIGLAVINRRFRQLVTSWGGLYKYLSILDLSRDMVAMYRAFDTKHTQKALHLNINVTTPDRWAATRLFLSDVGSRLVEVHIANGEGLGDIAMKAVEIFGGRMVSIPQGLSENMQTLRLEKCDTGKTGTGIIEYLNAMPRLKVLALSQMKYVNSPASARSSDVIAQVHLPSLVHLMLDMKSVEHEEILLGMETGQKHDKLKHVVFAHLPEQNSTKVELVRLASRLVRWDFAKETTLVADRASNMVVQGEYERNGGAGDGERSLKAQGGTDVLWVLLFRKQIRTVDFACEAAIPRFCCQDYNFRTVSFVYPAIKGILTHATTHYPGAQRLVLRWSSDSDEDDDEYEDEDAVAFWADHTKEEMCELRLRTIAVHGPRRRCGAIRRAQPPHAWMHPVIEYTAREVCWHEQR
jgi:hypothetical protein